MFYLGPLYDGYNENRKFTHLFWRSCRQPVYLSLHNPHMFSPAQHFTFGTNRHFTDVTRQEIEDVTEAMKVARLAFLQGGLGRSLQPVADHDLRAVLERLSLHGVHPPMYMMRTEEVAQAVLRAVEDGDLIFVPEWDALRACVKAIQEDRQKRPAPAAQQQNTNPYATVQQMMGKPPRMPSRKFRPSCSVIDGGKCLWILMNYPGERSFFI